MKNKSVTHNILFSFRLPLVLRQIMMINYNKTYISIKFFETKITMLFSAFIPVDFYGIN